MKIKLFPNQNTKSLQLAEQLRSTLISYGHEIVKDGQELAIAIGGDGSYLRMVKENQFNSQIYYIGMNTGTLGFLQEIKPMEMEEFSQKLKEGLYKIEEFGIQKTKIITDTFQKEFYSLNEIVIRDQNLNTANLKVCINNELLEHYAGDGLLIATSIGSTAYNISLGGNIVYSDLHTLQITPIAPLNTMAYRNLLNSIILPEERKISIFPEKRTKDLLVSVDGENQLYQNVQEIQTSISKKRIKCLRMKDYDYTKIIHEKFL